MNEEFERLSEPGKARYWLRTYVRSNFLPSLPERFGDLAFEAITMLEAGGDLCDTVSCDDMEIVPWAAEIVPAEGFVCEFWRIEIGELLHMLHLEDSISIETINRLNEEMDNELVS